VSARANRVANCPTLVPAICKRHIGAIFQCENDFFGARRVDGKEVFMIERKRTLGRWTFLAAGLFLVVALVAVVKTTGKEGTDSVANEKWEYLALAGPSTTNFTPTGNP